MNCSMHCCVSVNCFCFQQKRCAQRSCDWQDDVDMLISVLLLLPANLKLLKRVMTYYNEQLTERLAYVYLLLLQLHHA